MAVGTCLKSRASSKQAANSDRKLGSEAILASMRGSRLLRDTRTGPSPTTDSRLTRAWRLSMQLSTMGMKRMVASMARKRGDKLSRAAPSMNRCRSQR